MLDYGIVGGGGGWNRRLDNEEFIDIGVFFYNMGFDNLVRIYEDGVNMLIFNTLIGWF